MKKYLDYNVLCSKRTLERKKKKIPHIFDKNFNNKKKQIKQINSIL
jgi:hypothetical protein